MAVLVPFRGMSELATTGCIFTDLDGQGEKEEQEQRDGKGGTVARVWQKVLRGAG